MIQLQTDRLRVEIPFPDEGPNISHRFSHEGFISEVVLDGIVHYCASEPKNLRHPSSGGRGLCNEYRFNICEDTPVGEYFPKFGIGLFKKEEEGKYVFYKHYNDVVPFEIEITYSSNQAVFETKPMVCQRFALKTVKTITVKDNTLTMEVMATNTGEKEMALEEFCHNFISIDGMAIGSDYQLDLPNCPDMGYGRMDNRSGGRPGSMRGNGKGLTFCEYSAIDTDVAIDCSLIDDTTPFTWTIRHRGAKASVSCKEGFKPSKIAIWAVDHILSPEIVHGFTLKPGQTHRWKRVWTFERDI